VSTSFTLGAGRFPVGTTVGVYARRVMVTEAGPVGGTLVTSAVTGSDLRTTFSGLEYATEYWAAALVGGSWRKVAFATEPEPEVVGLRAARVTTSLSPWTLTTATWTLIGFDVGDFDTDAIHDAESNNSRLTCVTPGKYRIYAVVVFEANATGSRAARFRVGEEVVVGGVVAANAGAADETVLACSAVHEFTAAGEFVELQVMQRSGGDLDVLAESADALPMQTCFGMERIG
jgi:hypothetical protein